MAQEHKIIKVGHRGAMGYESENTLASFRKALDLKVDMTEFDVYVCKTGELVVIHDDTVDRTTNGKGNVIDKTLTELKELGIPTVEEVLDLIDRKIKANIELKGDNTAKPVSDIIEKYVEEKGWSYEDFLVSSFNHSELKKFKDLNPKVKIGLLVEEIADNFLDFVERFNAHSVNIPLKKKDEKFIEEKFVNDAHNRGLKVYIWACNTLEEIKKAKSLNVDYICSNYPDKI